MKKLLNLTITITDYEKSKKLENDLQALINRNLTDNADINNLWKSEGFFGFELREEGKFLFQIKELEGFYNPREIFDIILEYYNLDLKEINSAHYVNKNKLLLFKEPYKTLFKNYLYLVNKDGTINNNYDHALIKICQKYFELNEEKDGNPISVREILKQMTKDYTSNTVRSLMKVKDWHSNNLALVTLEKSLEKGEVKLIERRVYNRKQIKSFLRGVE